MDYINVRQKARLGLSSLISRTEPNKKV